MVPIYIMIRFIWTDEVGPWTEETKNDLVPQRKRKLSFYWVLNEKLKFWH